MRGSTIAVLAGAAVVLALPGAAAAAPVAGDFDGDGRDDLAVGVIGQTVGGDDFAGAVHVIYGGRKGLSRRDRVFTQDTKGVNERAEAGDSFGGALAIADFDRDGRDDLAVGVPFESIGGVDNAGVVQILYGSRRGLGSRGDQLIAHGRNGFGPEPDPFDSFGWSLATGNFGKGRHGDLAVATTQAIVDGFDNAGMVEVLHGSRRGLRTRGAKRFTQATPGIGDDPEVGDQFGWTLASGDVGRDGHDDLAVGVPFESIDSANSAGAVQLIYGSDRGPRRQGALFLDQLVLDGGVGGVDVEPEAGDQFGWNIAIGNFGRSKREDIAIAAPDEDVEGPADALDGGVVMIGFGARGGLRTGATGNIQVIYEAAVTSAFNAGTRFGRTLRAANFGRGRRDDLALSLPGADGTSAQDAGAVGVLYGSATGLTPDGSDLIDQDSPGVAGEANDNEEFGRFLAAGRFDGRGPFDLAVADPYERSPGPVLNAGAVAVFRAAQQGITVNGDRLLRQGARGLGGKAQSGDYFGSALSASSSGVFFD